MGIVLSDGCRLSARVWMPEDAATHPVPAILEYIPYRKRDGTLPRDEMMHPYFAGHGYAAVRVDMRGSGDSDGILYDEYLKQEQDDALEVIAWLAEQTRATNLPLSISYLYREAPRPAIFASFGLGFKLQALAATRSEQVVERPIASDRFEVEIVDPISDVVKQFDYEVATFFQLVVERISPLTEPVGDVGQLAGDGRPDRTRFKTAGRFVDRRGSDGIQAQRGARRLQRGGERFARGGRAPAGAAR